MSEAFIHMNVFAFVYMLHKFLRYVNTILTNYPFIFTHSVYYLLFCGIKY